VASLMMALLQIYCWERRWKCYNKHTLLCRA